MHATCVSVFGNSDSGCLFMGPSGAGKSDLALRLIDAGGALVADDRVILTAQDGALVAAPPPLLAGLLEIRGLGIVTVPHLDSARIRLVVTLTDAAAIERLPPLDTQSLNGIEAPRMLIDAAKPSAAARVRWAMGRIVAYGRLDGITTLVPGRQTIDEPVSPCYAEPGAVAELTDGAMQALPGRGPAASEGNAND